MKLSRRDMLKGSGALVALGACGSRLAFAQDAAAGLKSMTGDVKPIAKAEYLARIAQARTLMARHDLGALLIEPGSSLVYFTGVHWWRSERLTAAVIPREGDIAIVTPHFE